MSGVVQSASPDLSATDFAAIADLVDKECGIQLNQGKLGLVKSRLQKRLRVTGLTSFDAYVKHVQSNQGRDEMDELICAISTNVTGFNREPHHFVHFREQVLPVLKEKLAAGEPVRIWSAGCSNGSEAHTIACTVLEAIPTAAKSDFRILATDIDKYSLEVGRSGHYSEDMVSKMAPETLERWFTKTEKGYQLHDGPRSLVSFKTLNLMTKWPMKMKYDVVFCRNVLIYFSQDVQTTLFQNFSRYMKEGAHFYIGHSERVLGPAADVLISIGATTYRYESRGNK